MTDVPIVLKKTLTNYLTHSRVKDDRKQDWYFMELNGVQLPFVPLGGVGELNSRPQRMPAQEPQKPFADILQEEVGKLKFSAHAQSRISSREMNLSTDDMKRLETAVNKADDKGAKDSLVLLRDMAFIVSVQNRTVITALKGEQAQDNVFTNIDSAIVA